MLEDSNLENTENLTNPTSDSTAIDSKVSNLGLTNAALEVYNSDEPFDGYVSLGADDTENSFVTQNLVSGNPFNTSTPPPINQPLGDISKLTDDEKNSRYNQYKNSVRQVLKNSTYNFQDPNQWGGIYNYNAGPNSNTYWERYHDLWGDGDHELDFHPLKDNEAAYNMATSGWERGAYSLAGMSQLAIAGLSGTYDSFGKLLVGDFTSPDHQTGRAFDRVNKLYSNTNDGTGAFVGNLVMNFGYTLGILGSLAVDGGFSRMFKLGAAGRYVPSIRKAKSFVNMKSANRAEGAVDGARIAEETLDQLNNINASRKWYQGWNIRRLTETQIGRAVNPFSNMTAARYKILDGADDITGLASTSVGFGDFYRDFRNINLAVAESRLESALNRERQFDTLYSEFYKDKLRAPKGAELESMISAADATAHETSLWNTAIIYFTNKLAFDNILNPTALNRVFGKKINDIAKIGRGEFGPIGKVTLESGKGAVFRKRGYRTWIDGWKTDPIAKSLGNTIGYFKVNILEGLQESFQEIIADATYEHYRKLYYADPARKGIIEKAMFGEGSASMSEYSKAAKKQISPEGLEIFGSGFFMGFLSGGLAKGLNAARTRSAKMYDPQGYKDYIEFESEIGERLADRINSLGVKEFTDSGYFNAGTQLGVNTVTKNGDIKENKDAEIEGVISHVLYLKKHGMLDLYIENFKTYQDLTNEEFIEANPTISEDEVGKYKSKIPQIVEKLKQIDKVITNTTKKYKNPVDLNGMESWMEGYEDAVFMHNAWEEGIKQAVFFNENWNDVSKRMISIQKTHYNNRASESLSKSDSDLILTIKDKYGMSSEISRLKDEIKSLTDQGTPESKQSAKERQKRLNSLEEYYTAWTNFDDYFHRDRYKADLKTTLQSEKAEGEEVTEEDVDKVLDKQLGKKSIKQEGKLLDILKVKYKNLLTELGQNTDFIFDEKVAEGFRDVIDYYKLSDEKAKLGTLINFINDPQGFYSLYEKNLNWMKKLYNERGAYATEVVKRELNDIVGNNLLNVLADDGIFMTAADFIAWKDHGIAPSEFYDEINKMVIPENSPVFNRYMQKLFLYQAFVSKNEELEEGSKYREYVAKKRAIKNKKDVQIEKEKESFKTRNKITVEKFEKQNTKEVATDKNLQNELNKYIKLKKDVLSYTDTLTFGEEIVSQFNIDNETWDAVVNSIDQSDVKIQKLIVDYGKTAKLGQGISKEDKAALENQFGLYKVASLQILDATIEELENNLETEIVSDFNNTPEGKVYSAAIKKINDSYNAELQKIENSYTDEEKQPPVSNPEVNVKPVVSKSSNSNAISIKWDSLDEELTDILTTQFELYLDAAGKSADLKNLDKKEYLRLRNNWLKHNTNIVAEYNKQKEAEKPKTPEEVEVPKLKTLSGTVPDKLNQIDLIINKLKSDLKTKKTNEERKDLEFDIDALISYRDLLSQLKRPQGPSERNWRLFETMILGKQSQVERVLGDNNETIGYRFTSNAADAPAPTRSTQYAEQLANKKFKLDSFEYSAVKEKNFNKNTGKTYRGGLLNLFDVINDMDLSQQEKVDAIIQTISTDKSYIQLKESGKLAVIKTALEGSFSLDTLKTVVNRVAFNESTIAGNTIDVLFRTALTIDENGNFVKPTKPENMSDEAFESLVGSEGIITKLQQWAKDGDYFFYVGDALIFDKTAMQNGVVGAMDIFAFNRKTKEFHIIDIKTSKNFGKEDEFNDAKMYKYGAQQSIYRNLVHNMMGETPSKISLLPIEINVNMDGYINSLEKAGSIIKKKQIDDLKAQIKNQKGDNLKELNDKIKAIEQNIAIDIPYIEDVEAGVPLVKPTDVPIELQGPVLNEQSFDPFLSKEVKEQFKDSKTAITIEKLGLKIRNSKDLNEANSARMEALILAQSEPAIAAKITEMLKEEYDAKKEALTNEVSSSNLAKSMYLVSENPIFEEGGNIVVVDKVYKKGDVDMVTVKSIGLKKTKQKSMTVTEANNLFDKATSDQVDTVIKATAEEKANAKTSKQNQNEYNKQNPVGKPEIDTDNDADIFGEEPNDC